MTNLYKILINNVTKYLKKKTNKQTLRIQELEIQYLIKMFKRIISCCDKGSLSRLADMILIILNGVKLVCVDTYKFLGIQLFYNST